MVLLRFPIFLAAAMSLAACGGDSDSNVDPDLGPLTPGVLEGPVIGLRYETGSKSGITDENGAFSYRSGERVRFYVGDILVGDALGADSLTLFNLAGLDTPPVTAAEVRATINQIDTQSRERYNRLATPFETAANLAALLYTLDEDGNASNGIVIPPAIHLLAAGAEINSGGPQFSFAGQSPLRKLLHNANSANVWPTERALRNRSLAMDALYASLALVPEIYVNTRVDIDHGDDGSIDAVYTWTLDANGFVNDDHLDENNDGSVDTGVEHRYDAAGNTLSVSHIFAGAPRYTVLFSLDNRGAATKVEEIYGDGRDSVTHYTRGYSGLDYTASVDSGADGSIDAIRYYHFDQEGLLRSVDKDTDNNGAIELQDLFYYDSRGLLARAEFDVSALGVPSQTFTYTNNAYGQSQMFSHDADGDGHDDRVTEYQYNSRQQLIRRTFDDGADGSIENDDYWHYDANGYLLEEGRQVTSPVSYSAITAYTRDAQGNILTSDLDRGDDEIWNETSTYVYDANGNLTEVVRRQSSNGVIISRSSYSRQQTSRWSSVLTPPLFTYYRSDFPR